MLYSIMRQEVYFINTFSYATLSNIRYLVKPFHKILPMVFYRLIFSRSVVKSISIILSNLIQWLILGKIFIFPA